MKHNILKTLTVAALMAGTTTASAQVALRSGYFVEGYSYRHQLNPALAPDRGYVSIPILSGLNTSIQSNVGISNFLYTQPGTDKLMLFTNKAVDSQQFLNGLNDVNRLNANISLTILSVGNHKWGGFNTFELTLHNEEHINLPKGLFEFIKDVSSAHEYNFSGLGLSSTSYLEFALGHSRRITNEWRAGAKVKVLVGAADVDAKIENMKASLNADKWALEGHGYVDAAVAGLTAKHKNGTDEIKDFEYDKPGVAGYGFAVDLGFTYRPRWVKGLEISGAINDLGFIKWKGGVRGIMDGKWECDGLYVSQDDKDGVNQVPGTDRYYNSFDTELDNLGDQLEEAFKFNDDRSYRTRKNALHSRLNFGASYKLPWYDKLKFGLLSSTHIAGDYAWSEARLSANVSPVKCLDFTVDYAASKFGHSMGWLLNVHTRGIAFFVGSDHMLFKITPQGIPAGKLNANIQVGLNFHLGHRQSSDKL